MFSSKIQGYAKMRKKWQLFHATDFLSLMHPCFSFCRILGIFPYKINILTFEASKPYYIMSSVIICICCILNLALIHDIFISKVMNFEDVIESLETLAFYTISGFVVSTTHVLSGSRMRLLQTILEISSKLPSESYQKLSRLIHVKDILGNILLIVQSSMFVFNVQTFELTYLNVLDVIFMMYLQLIMFQMTMLYINCLCVLKSCFKRINDNLVYMQKLLVKDIKPRVSGIIWHTQRNQFLLIELKTLKKQHLIISETLQMMNITFSPQLLATIVMSLIETTIELYFYVVRWKDGVFISLEWQFSGIFLATTVFYTMKITLLVWACETGKNQAQKISTTIHDVLNSTSDEQIKNELQLFSLQILHRKNIFSIKAFTMDASLLTAACFKKINDDLNYMQRLMTNDMKSSVPSLICSTQRNQIFLIELKTLMKQHLMINEIVRLLNIIFSLQLLATVIVTFVEITCELYHYIVHWQGEVIITFDRNFLDTFLTSMTHYVMKVILIVWACETGKNQTREIGITIYDVLNSTRDKQIKGELQLFSLQILHCKNTFLTKGLAMDATLLAAMVGGITTYMLILIQFLIAAHSCDEKSGINITNNSVI
ncbi:Putative gustatory receptor 28b [Trachymyrmex zeteki]|uniref:Gustatory receptor n=1 Tax=Mycetomoellerius zeteki TaxID=64791 RepID=A0A151XHV6_9HYME|nr:Putative gustatory receptor 28b [Trachymyrmex zeteki]